MKRIIHPINLVVLILFVLFTLFFLWQFRINLGIRRVWKERSLELKEAQVASKSLEKLEKQSEDLKEKEEALYRRVPLDEKQPLSLIKEFISIGGEIGLKGMTFNIKEEGLLPEQAPGSLANRPKPINLEMRFEGTFLQLLDFLKRINNLERLVTVSGLEIKRVKEILPFQKISLRLITYTFLQK